MWVYSITAWTVYIISQSSATVWFVISYFNARGRSQSVWYILSGEQLKKEGAILTEWNWLLIWIRPNGLLQWPDDIKPEMALWRERELILLLCHKCSHVRNISFKSTELNYFWCSTSKVQLNKAIRRRQGFRNNLHLKHSHLFHPHKFNSLDFPLPLKLILVKLIL